ncbi:unnamed protein product [Onchocerca ochengi]|uniref:PH domain-containing protein n=1 Tax=Onchocerca ochengi TaxID=42157 RepID=A0A182EUH0_ONCOC|nr:unnamed protein product [Onchocerca ochengi]
MISTESNPKITSEKKFEDHDHAIPGNDTEGGRKETINENEMLEANYASREQQRSEILANENLEKIDVAENFKYNEGIPKIVVCSHESIMLDVEKLVPEPDTKRAELREKFEIEANAEILDQQKLPLEEIENVEQLEISKNDEFVTSIKTDAAEEINDEKQSTNKFLKQYLDDMIQDITQSAEEIIKTSKAPIEKEPEKVDEIQKMDENQHATLTSKSSYRFPDDFLKIDISKSESDQQEQSYNNMLLTAKSNNSDTSTGSSELSDISRELVNISHSYLTDITGKFQEGEEHSMLTGHESNVDYDSPLQQVRSYAVAKFSKTTEQIGELKGYPYELKFEKKKSELEIAQTSNGSSENMIPKFHSIINGLTADGQLILYSISDSMQSSEDKFINYSTPNNNDTSETSSSEKISLISDTNGNPEWEVYDDMRHIPSNATNESNNCAADMNANISALQEKDQMKSVMHEQEMDQHNMPSDEHSLLEQCNTGTESEVINMNNYTLDEEIKAIVDF